MNKNATETIDLMKLLFSTVPVPKDLFGAIAA